MIIPIYNNDGNKINEFLIPDETVYVSGRVSVSFGGTYYKGAGIPYKGHFMTNPSQDQVLSKSDVFYAGSFVKNPKWIGKTGIFCERYQPYFSDWIGSCGPKESKIINHSNCEKSSVEVIDCVTIMDNQQYFKLHYKCGRQGYKGNSLKLIELINFMVVEGWCFPWDKTAIRDITIDGRISDVADLFKSTQLKHRLGTVYAILYSLAKTNAKLYLDLLETAKVTHRNDMDFIYLAIHFLNDNGINIDPLFRGKSDYTIYKHILSNFLIMGRNCGHVESKKFGDKVRSRYLARLNGNSRTT